MINPDAIEAATQELANARLVLGWTVLVSICTLWWVAIIAISFFRSNKPKTESTNP